MNCWWIYLRLGLRGNQPFSTRLAWSKISLTVQNEEKANTPSNVDHNTFSTHIDNATPMSPNTKNHHQQRVPK